MSSDHHWLCPTGYQTRYVLAHNRFTEYSAAQDITESTIRTQPHFLEVELYMIKRRKKKINIRQDRVRCDILCRGRIGAFDSRLIRSNCSTLYTDRVFLHSLRSLLCNFVISFISVFHAKVIVFKVDVQVGQNEFFLNLVPDDTSHFIAVHLHNGILDFDFLVGISVCGR